MKLKAVSTSPLENECLYGETVQVEDEFKDWVYCKLATDNYKGWVQKSSLGKLKKATHRVINKSTFIYKDANPKSETIMRIPMGARLAVEDIKYEWAETFFFINNKAKIGYIPEKHIVDKSHKVQDWVTIAQKLEGTPYKWGGRDSSGIDCSALLQLSYHTYGQNIPRNSSDQVKLNKNIIKNIDDLKRGCVIFWSGHVAIMTDQEKCIHANAFHMRTITEPLINIIDRADKDYNIIKMMNFN